MNCKIRIILATITIMIISLFMGCNNNVANKIYNDNNKISKDYDTFGLSDSNEKAESNEYKGKFKLSGDVTIWKYESDKNSPLQASYTLSVKSGKAKIVLIYPDNKVTTLVENTSEETNTNETKKLTLPIRKGTNRIKIVGYKDADINIKIHIDEGTFQETDF